MIPKSSTPNIELTEFVSKTYDLSNTNTYLDGLGSVKQAVSLILSTNRFKHSIHSWDYGVELDDLIGKSKAYVYPEIERRVKEALLQDERIESIGAFSFEETSGKVEVSFTITTKYGDFESGVVVSV